MHTAGAPIAGARDARRAAFASFLAVVVIGALAWWWAGRHRWFFQDEWDFLATRDAADLDSLMRPHSAHWSTLPILVWRALWHGVGLHSYFPYQAVAIALHLLVAGLLRAVIRRAGVHPWIATVAASLFVLLGAGHENVVWAFQSAWPASVAFGLVHLLCADHDGSPVTRRDAAGVAAGLASLMSSGLGVTMVFVVGVAMALRRRWSAAVLHTVPLGLVYGLWSLAYLPGNTLDRRAGAGDLVAFIGTGLWEALMAVGQWAPAAIATLVLLVLGGAVALARADAGARSRAAPAIALSTGSLAFVAIVALGRARDFGTEFARNGRYSYVIVALVLPALALAADAIVRRWRWAAALLAAMTLLAVAGNLRTMFELRDDELEAFERSRTVILTIPRIPIAHDVPGRQQVDPPTSPALRVGWLVDAARDGSIPAPADSSPVALASAHLQVALVQVGPSRARLAERDCEARTGRPIELDVGSVLVVERRARIIMTTDDGVRSWPRRFVPDGATALVPWEPLALEIEPLNPGGLDVPVQLCGPLE